MADEFFDDEQELMEADAARAARAHQAAQGVSAGTESAASAPAAPAKSAQVSRSAAAASAPAAGADDARRDPPPFWMVLAIAAIALLLGMVIGYLIGTSTALSSLETLSSDEVQQQYGTSSTDNAADDGSVDSEDVLPEGHPKLDIAEDGTATLADEGDSGSSAS